MKFIILALLGTLMLSSCVTGGKMTGLREGLTKEEVTRIMGAPMATSAAVTMKSCSTLNAAPLPGLFFPAPFRIWSIIR